jgi:hypothetical protein
MRRKRAGMEPLRSPIPPTIHIARWAFRLLFAETKGLPTAQAPASPSSEITVLLKPQKQIVSESISYVQLIFERRGATIIANNRSLEAAP